MPGATSEQFDRPKLISLALKLLYASLGVGILRSILEFQTLTQRAPGNFILIGFILFVWIIVFGFFWLLLYLIGKRYNWARITFVVLFVIGVPFSFFQLLQSLPANPASGLLGILQMALQIFAIVMLFQQTSIEWFKKTKEA